MAEVILGPPGTGKTTALLAEVEKELAAGTAPDRVGYVSYTRRAADEARDRARLNFGLGRDELPYFRTLHSLCHRMLGLSSGVVLQGPRLQKFAEHAGIVITGRWSEDGTLSGFELGDRILHLDFLARMRCIPLEAQHHMASDGLGWEMVRQVCMDLAEYKRQVGLVDFTDMLEQFLASSSPPPIEVLVVDEAQDLSQLQWRVVWKLARGCRRVIIAGDDDQAIYLWAGADVEELVGLSPGARVLGRSWRVPSAIQKVALAIIANVTRRAPKAWEPREGDPGSVDYAPEIQGMDLSGPDIMVLARNSYIIHQQVVPELRSQGIVYLYNGVPSISHQRLTVIENWETLRSGGSVSGAQARAIYEHMTSGRGVVRGHKRLPGIEDDEEVTLQLLRQQGGLLTDAIWHEALDRLPPADVRYIITARQRGEHLRRPRVRVSTIHGSKGGQADHVVLFREVARRTARELVRNPEEEARVWYVGVTRARQRLTLVASQEPQACPWV
jgi:DNA helicase II / ATP-dependent DNA helicase PcrA